MIIEVSKGYQITIPADLRKEFGLGIGSPIEISKEDGKIVINPIKDELNELFKNAKNIKPKKRMNVSQMKELNEKMFR